MAAAVGLGGYLIDSPNLWPSVGLAFSSLCVVRAWRSGVVLNRDRLVVRNVLWTWVFALDQVRAVEISNLVTPLFYGFSKDLGLRVRLESGRTVRCAAVYGGKAPGVVRLLQRDLRNLKRA